MGKKTSIYAIFLLVSALMAVSCKSTRRISLQGHSKQISSEQLFVSVDTSKLDFHSFSGKFSCDLESKAINQSFKGTIRIVHDSAIWISLSPGLGIEAARLMLTPDSVFLINRLKSNYFKGRFSYLKQLLHVDVDYYTLEAIFTNRAFIFPNAGRKLDDFKNFELQRKSQFYQVVRTSVFEGTSASTKFCYDAAFHLFESLVRLEQEKMFLEAAYSEFAPVEAKQFPMVCQIKLGSAAKSFTMRMQYTKVETNQILEFPFRIPESYQPANY